jgi:hypothetical protein
MKENGRMARPKQHALKFSDILFLKILAEASELLTRNQAIAIFNREVYKRPMHEDERFTSFV